jgi:hypothetical protein
MPSQARAGIEAEILGEISGLTGAADRRVSLILTGRSFAAVQLDDGSAGAAMDYSRYPAGAAEAPVVDDPRLRDLFCGGLLAESSPLRLPAGEIGLAAQAVKVAIMSALCRPSLTGAALNDLGFMSAEVSYEDQRATECGGSGGQMLRDALRAARTVGVVGYGGFMEMCAALPWVSRVLVADLHAAHRLAQITATIGRLNAQYPEPRIEFVGGDIDCLRDLCDVVQVTASALCNGTMDELLGALHPAPLIVAGPSGAILPTPWFLRGAGLVCTELRDHRYLSAYRYDDHLYEWFAEYDRRVYIAPRCAH